MDELPSSILFAPFAEGLSEAEQINISHARAETIGTRFSLTIDDMLKPSRKFWDMFRHNTVILDGAATSLYSIQLNLAAGTLAPFVQQRPDLRPLMDDLLSSGFRVSGQYLLTEVGHGLDAPNLETTATLRADGTFDLHTPHPGAAKFMPPTLPYGGVRRVGIVMARLMVEDEDRGIRPFIVTLNDGVEMCTGITAKALPSRGGSKAMGHAITYFNHVILPPSALLGDISGVENPRRHFLQTIWRVGVGSLSLSATVIPSLKASAYIAWKYSQRRCVTGRGGQPNPIISFRTQQIPILNAISQAFVLDAFYEKACAWFVAISQENIELRNAIATIAKATMIGHWNRSGTAIVDRCGAQGTFDVNQILNFVNEIRGVSIAEGDTLVLSIRLASELLLRRYTVPEASYPDSLLARHEQGMLEGLTSILLSTESHRGKTFNELILPRCLPFVEAIGHRMAWEAALAAGVPTPLVRLYELGAIEVDLAWYVEHGSISGREEFWKVQSDAYNAVLEGMEDYVRRTGVAPYAVAPIVSEKSWDAYVSSLPSYGASSTTSGVSRVEGSDSTDRILARL
ncbi:acyl-CoA oxidase [Panus rudis PR-1116 ss-1]|nr:acyl-CoA oxidase [Panus rudis PR-1116 ss-1]